MTTLLEVRVRVGGDPSGFVEYETMREELGKLTHPACPLVDWIKVEQLCLALFSKNGAELQTVASYTLARSHLYGLAGVVEGLGLVELMVCDWPSLWPPATTVRVDILAWLFAQLQPLLRGVVENAGEQSELLKLDAKLENLHHLLLRHTHVPVMTLQALRQQIGSQIRRSNPMISAPGLLQPTMVAQPATFAAPPTSHPVVVLVPSVQPELPPAYIKPGRHRIFLWSLMAVIALSLIVWVGWHGWLANPSNDKRSILTTVLPRDELKSVHLDSLMLFDKGSDQLSADAARVLIDALVAIKARPDWLIVITGHSDGTGDANQNLQLSRSRALAVRDWMQAMGKIPDSCFVINGVASNQPVASNDSAAGRAANRRVDITLVPQAGPCG